MRVSGRDGVGRITKFFRMMFRHDSLTNHYQTNFALMQHHKYSLSDLEKMLPWEKTMYVTMLLRFIEEENEKIKQQINSRKK
jgi:hypothetical protein